MLCGRVLRIYFLSDDFNFLYSVSPLGKEWSLVAIFSPISEGRLYRPVITLLFWLWYRLWGLDPLWYHALSLLLHTVNTILVYYLGQRWMSKTSALMGALLFGVHFLHVESVAWISDWTDLLVTTFYLGTLILIADSENASSRQKMMALGTFFLALLSKEMAVTLLPMLIITNLWEGKHCRGRGLPWRWYTPFLGILILYLVLASSSLGLAVAGKKHTYGFRFDTITIGSMLWYPLAFLLPVPFVRLSRAFQGLLALVHGEEMLLSGTFAVDCLMLCLSIAVCLGMLWGIWRGNRAVRYALVWVWVTLLPVLPLSGNADRLAYLPSVGFALLVGLAFQWIRNRSHRLAWVLVLVTFLICATLTQARLTWWVQAGAIARGILEDLKALYPDLPPGVELWFAEVPDNVNGAYVYRNGLESAVRLVYQERNLSVHIVSEPSRFPEPCSQKALCFSLKGGRLTRWP